MSDNSYSFDRMRGQTQHRTEHNRSRTGKNSVGRDSIKIPDFVSSRNKASEQKPTMPIIKTERNPIVAKQPNKSKGLLGMFDLGDLEMDGDRSVILMLLALLSGHNNETDELLILALMYIML